MTRIHNTTGHAPVFTPRLVEGSTSAPRVVFLDPVSACPESIEGRVAQTADERGEVVFVINRYAIWDGNRRLGRTNRNSELPQYGVPDVVRHMRHELHAVFVATLPPAWLAGQVRSFAMSSIFPTISWAAAAHQWLTDLGPTASNRILWTDHEP